MTWDRFKQYYLQLDEIGFSIDISRVNFPSTFIDSIREPMNRAFEKRALSPIRMKSAWWATTGCVTPL